MPNRTKQEFRALGTNCIGVLEEVADLLYEPTQMRLNPENNHPYAKQRFKERIDAYIESRLQVGSDQEKLRKLGRALNDVVQMLKHEYTNRTYTEIAIESTISFVLILKRIDDNNAFKDAFNEVPF